jgi:MFS family permease
MMRAMAFPERARAAAPTPEPHAHAFGWFVAGVGTWFGAGGMQSVLFAWLVAGVLQAEARWVGIAQSASMIPSFFLLLIGGTVADRRDRRTLLIGLQLVASCVSAALLAVVASDALTLGLLIAYAVAMGTLTAFVTPARDSLLSEVAGRDLMRAVTVMSLTQWAAQALGNLVAGGVARIAGIVPALGLYALLLLSGVPTLRGIPPAPPPADARRGKLRFGDLAQGVLEVLRHPDLRAIALLVCAVGLLFVGPFMVVLPLLVRDYYQGGVLELGALSMAFPVGTILGSLYLLARPVRRKGLTALLALSVGSLFLGAISFGLPFWGTLIAITLWGVAAALFMNSSRTVFQQKASPAHRGRVLATYSLGFMGAAGLLGAPLSGFLVGAIGVLATCAAEATAMLLLTAVLWLTTRVTEVD